MEGLSCLIESDLLIALLAMIGLSIVVMVAVWRCTASWKEISLNLGFVLVLFLMGLWHFLIRHNAVISQLLPLDSLIVAGNWFGLWCGVLAGLAMRASRGNALRKAVPGALLMMTGLVALVYPVYGSIPQSVPHQTADGYCLQTNEVSCSPACAVTLLRMKGIEATEAEMIGRCLCRDGTAWQGLFRGLRQKTRGTDYRVEVRNADLQELRNMTPGYLLLSVGIDLWQECDPIYLEEYGWSRGKYHSVILTRFLDEEGCVEMIDPDVGLERWSLEDLQTLYRGMTIRLVSR